MYKVTLALITSFICVSQLMAQQESVVNIDTNVNSSSIYTDVDQKPVFFEGEKTLVEFYKKNSEYQICEKGEDGCKALYYQIIIDTAGKVGGFNILRGINEELNTESKKIIDQMPNWIPGKKDGKKVKVLMTLDMRFKVK